MFDDIRDFSSSVPEIKKFKPDIIFDDYIQLICSSSKDDRRFQIEKLVNDYKWLSKDMQCSTVLVSQLNRNVEYRGNKIPQLSDLAESGSIEQVAENVFFVFYEYKADPKSKLGSNVITLCARKVRYGDTGTVNLGYDGDKCTIYNDLNELQNRRQIANDDIPF
jgi:replicative DNA helicase